MNCELRAWRREDAKDLAEALNNKKVLDNLRDGLPYPYTVEDAEAFILDMSQADSNKTFAFAIIAEGKVVESIGVFRRENIHNRTAELSYYVGEPYWGRGIGTDAVRLLCRYIFQETDILRVFAEPFSQNKGSRRILEKNGFVLEGTLRKNAVKNNRVMDMSLYALIREEM